MQEVLETRRGIGDRAAPGPLTLDVHHDFPILSADREGRPLVWLDNAATTQKPRAVIDRLVQFYCTGERERPPRRPCAGHPCH